MVKKIGSDSQGIHFLEQGIQERGLGSLELTVGPVADRIDGGSLHKFWPKPLVGIFGKSKCCYSGDIRPGYKEVLCTMKVFE